jgi:hypothetical protein
MTTRSVLTTRPPASRRFVARRTGPGERAVLALVCLACAGVVVVLGTKLSFFNDDWYFLLQRPGLESHAGLDSLLAPHNSNLVILTALSYKLLVGIFGFGPQLPFRLLLATVIIATGIFVYVFVRARAGGIVAVSASAVVMLMGAAWEDLLFFGAGIDQIGSVATGLGALLALEREGRGRNGLACVLLACSIGFSNVGVPFVLAAAVAVLLRREPSQLWIPAVPALLFALWWAFYGSKQASHISLTNIEHLPRYVFDSLSFGLASLTGLNRGSTQAALARGHVLAVISLLGIAVWLFIVRRPRPQLLVLLCAVLAFWVLTGASFIPGREPFASRYQLVDAALLVLIGAELLDPFEIPPLLSGIVALLAVAVVVSNVTGGLVHGYRFMRTQSQFARADLGAIEIARNLAPASLWLLPAIARNPYLSGITAGRFFAETAAHGTPPVDSARELAAAQVTVRQSADSVLISAEHIAPTETGGQFAGARGCARLAAGAGRERALSTGPWLLRQVGGGVLVIRARRFAPAGASINLGLITPRVAERLDIPKDSISQPWWLSAVPVRGGGAALEICRQAVVGRAKRKR